MANPEIEASITHYQNVVRKCSTFNNNQQGRLQELQTVVQRLRDNWQSQSTARFDEIWDQVRRATRRMHESMDQMIGTLEQHQMLIDASKRAQFSALDFSDTDDAYDHDSRGQFDEHREAKVATRSYTIGGAKIAEVK